MMVLSSAGTSASPRSARAPRMLVWLGGAALSARRAGPRVRLPRGRVVDRFFGMEDDYNPKTAAVSWTWRPAGSAERTTSGPLGQSSRRFSTRVSIVAGLARFRPSCFA